MARGYAPAPRYLRRETEDRVIPAQLRGNHSRELIAASRAQVGTPEPSL
jgi:hypothetical protein